MPIWPARRIGLAASNRSRTSCQVSAFWLKALPAESAITNHPIPNFVTTRCIETSLTDGTSFATCKAIFIAQLLDLETTERSTSAKKSSGNDRKIAALPDPTLPETRSRCRTTVTLVSRRIVNGVLKTDRAAWREGGGEVRGVFL